MTTPPPKKKKKSFGSLPAPRSGYATTVIVFFAHLLTLEYTDHHQHLISSSLYYPGPLHKISSQSIHNFLSNVVHRQTDSLGPLKQKALSPYVLVSESGMWRCSSS